MSELGAHDGHDVELAVALPKPVAARLIAEGNADYWTRDRDPGAVESVLQVIGVAADVVGLSTSGPALRHAFFALVGWARRERRESLTLQLRGIELRVDLTNVDDVAVVREITDALLSSLDRR